MDRTPNNTATSQMDCTCPNRDLARVYSADRA